MAGSPIDNGIFPGYIHHEEDEMNATTVDTLGPVALAVLRRGLEVTQRDLAGRLMVSQATLSRWENLQRNIQARDLKAWRTQLKRIVARRAR